MQWLSVKPTNHLIFYIEFIKIHSNLLYCGDHIYWKTLPCLNRAMKFILSEYIYDYKTRLIKFGILPLMYTFEIADIIIYDVFINSVKNPSNKFNILDFASFDSGPYTRSTGKLNHKTSATNKIMKSYFYHLPRLWNNLPTIDLSRSPEEIKFKLKGITFKVILIVIPLVPYIIFVLVSIVPSLLHHTTIIYCNFVHT